MGWAVVASIYCEAPHTHVPRAGTRVRYHEDMSLFHTASLAGMCDRDECEAKRVES